MAGTSDYHGLLNFIFLMVFSDAFGTVESVHYGHVTVHKDQAVGVTISFAVLDDVESILTVRCPIYKVCYLEIILINDIWSVEFG
jgi:hypothetical protein